LLTPNGSNLGAELAEFDPILAPRGVGVQKHAARHDPCHAMKHGLPVDLCQDERPAASSSRSEHHAIAVRQGRVHAVTVDADLEQASVSHDRPDQLEQRGAVDQPFIH
jgi:hypothetical protein